MTHINNNKIELIQEYRRSYLASKILVVLVGLSLLGVGGTICVAHAVPAVSASSEALHALGRLGFLPAEIGMPIGAILIAVVAVLHYRQPSLSDKQKAEDLLHGFDDEQESTKEDLRSTRERENASDVGEDSSESWSDDEEKKKPLCRFVINDSSSTVKASIEIPKLTGPKPPSRGRVGVPQPSPSIAQSGGTHPAKSEKRLTLSEFTLAFYRHVKKEKTLSIFSDTIGKYVFVFKGPGRVSMEFAILFGNDLLEAFSSLEDHKFLLEYRYVELDPYTGEPKLANPSITVAKHLGLSEQPLDLPSVE